MQWSEMAQDLQKAVRLRTFPLGFKLLASDKEIQGIPKLKRLGHIGTWCQVMTLARTSGRSFGVEAKDVLPNCGAMIGLREPPIEETIPLRANYWVKSTEDAGKMIRGLYRIPCQGHKMAIVGALASFKFDPDVIVCYGTPAQMVFLMCGLQRMEYKSIKSIFSGESSCSDGIPRCFITGEPSLMIPCYGERKFGHCPDEELSFVVKPDDFEKVCSGVKVLAGLGVRYPITPFGCESDVKSALEKIYPHIPGYETTK